MGLKLKDYFVFDGESSADFGFFASGENAYNSPEKDYEVYEVPGRNGDVMIDNNRFKNVTVKYPCYYEKTGGNLTKDISEFRNMLLSKSGYKRLYDTHNPDEYRLAVCRNVIETDPTEYDLLGAVEIEFDCKPQRYLVSGETPVTVTSGEALVNPTPFSSSPLLMVEGYGDININDDVISIQDSPIGWTPLIKPTSITVESLTDELNATFNATNLYYSGDTVRVSQFVWRFSFKIEEATIGSISVTDSSGNLTIGINRFTGVITLTTRSYSNQTFSIGTSGRFEYQPDITFEYTDQNDVTQTIKLIFLITADYDSTGITMNNIGYGKTGTGTVVPQGETMRLFDVAVDSTYSALGNPLYFDLETGEAYKYDDDEYVSVNNAVWLGADLPVLNSGINTITYGSNIHDFKVVPRWWKI